MDIDPTVSRAFSVIVQLHRLIVYSTSDKIHIIITIYCNLATSLRARRRHATALFFVLMKCIADWLNINRNLTTY